MALSARLAPARELSMTSVVTMRDNGAPGWAIHNHASDVGPVYEMTIQDMPFMINNDSLLWQEDLKGQISLLGSHAGFETNREKVA